MFQKNMSHLSSEFKWAKQEKQAANRGLLSLLFNPEDGVDMFL
jgi:hypothetical protein